MKLTKENIEKICNQNQKQLNGSIIKVNNDECYLIVTAWYEGAVEYQDKSFVNDGFNIIKTIHLRGSHLFRDNHFNAYNININNMLASTIMYKDFRSIVRYFDGNIGTSEYLTPEDTQIDKGLVTWLQKTVINSLQVELENNGDII